ncbi:MAG: protein-L-isoaspartate O-methyltransferase [Erythrobacter sp.]
MTELNSNIARKAMIDSQLRTSGVNDEYVLARMNSVPREDFVPESVKAIAYIDRAVPVGDGDFLCPPVVHGKMLAEAAPTKDDRVLVINGGTSYFAELIRPLVADVQSIGAKDVLNQKGREKFSLIVVEGAIEEVPSNLAKQLDEGGRIVTGLVLRDVTRLATGRKVAGTVALQPIADIGIPVLHEFDQAEAWSFS